MDDDNDANVVWRLVFYLGAALLFFLRIVQTENQEITADHETPVLLEKFSGEPAIEKARTAFAKAESGLRRSISGQARKSVPSKKSRSKA